MELELYTNGGGHSYIGDMTLIKETTDFRAMQTAYYGRPALATVKTFTGNSREQNMKGDKYFHSKPVVCVHNDATAVVLVSE